MVQSLMYFEDGTRFAYEWDVVCLEGRGGKDRIQRFGLSTWKVILPCTEMGMLVCVCVGGVDFRGKIQLGTCLRC